MENGSVMGFPLLFGFVPLISELGQNGAKRTWPRHGTNISVRLWNNMFAYELEGSLHLLKSTENPGQYSVPYIYLCTCQYCSYKVIFCEICDRWLRFTDLHLGCGCVSNSVKYVCSCTCELFVFLFTEAFFKEHSGVCVF